MKQPLEDRITDYFKGRGFSFEYDKIHSDILDIIKNHNEEKNHRHMKNLILKFKTGEIEFLGFNASKKMELFQYDYMRSWLFPNRKRLVNHVVFDVSEINDMITFFVVRMKMIEAEVDVLQNIKTQLPHDEGSIYTVMIPHDELIRHCEHAIECWEKGGELPLNGNNLLREIINRYKSMIAPKLPK